MLQGGQVGPGGQAGGGPTALDKNRGMDTYFRAIGSKVNSLQAGVHQAFQALRTAWQAATSHGSVDLIEVCCASDSTLADTIKQHGGRFMRCSIWNGYDLHSRDGVDKLSKDDGTAPAWTAL